ncbi:S-adenosylmethionine mitochondrial carrier protein [Taenia solium]|eukprot:TsM_000608300 transcript=TsM_000608300 gene=TsM_000608300
MSGYRIHFDYPTKVETARMNNKARSLFVRLTFPGLHKPSPEPRRSKACGGCRCSCTSAPSSQDDHEPVWSNLTKPPARSSSKSAVSNSPSNWTSVQPSQKPANGDIWIRVASNRVSLMLILCGPSPLTQRVDSRASEALQESLKSLSISDLRDQEGETYSDHFPTLYYYWDSGRLSRKLDPVKSSMAVAETCVCLMLAAAARGEGWSDEDLKMVHRSVRVSTPPIPRKRTVEKRDFCWQESVKDTEEVSSKNFVIVDCENGTELLSKSPEIGDVESNECGEGEEDRPPRSQLMSTAFSLNHEQLAALLSGATAGVCVDMAVYPMDTIKTRLQSAAHVVKPGWRGLYRGYWSQVSRGLPFSLIQYPIWELLKRGMEHYNRRQTLDASLLDFKVGEECFFNSNESNSLSKKQFAVCGAIAGAIGGSSTTPMDVAKTRIMLAELPPQLRLLGWSRCQVTSAYGIRSSESPREWSPHELAFYGFPQKGTPLASGSVTVALRTIYREGGISGLFAGLVPRVYIKCFGGAVFLGLYDISKRMWLAYLPTKSFDTE